MIFFVGISCNPTSLPAPPSGTESRKEVGKEIDCADFLNNYLHAVAL